MGFNKYDIDEKEIYFTNDIINKISKDTGVAKYKVERAIVEYINFLKDTILKTSHIVYEVPQLGALCINRKDIASNIERFKTKRYRANTKEEKELYDLAYENFKIRRQKINIELEKFRYRRRYMEDNVLRRRKGRLLKLVKRPNHIRALANREEKPLKEILDAQNEFAYTHYDKLRVTPETTFLDEGNK